jgi:hypothetical protein
MKGRTKLVARLLSTTAIMIVLSAGVALAVTRIHCTGGPCEGTQNRDLISGTRGSDLIYAKGATDGVNARGGSDLVRGGPGEDAPGGSPSGHDPSYHLEGGPGHDHVNGGPGDDSVTDEYGPATGNRADVDVLFGARGNDFLNAQDGDGLDHLDCGAGRRNLFSADPGDTVLANCQKNIG